MKLHLEDRHRKILKEILNKYPYQFYAFGSRVKGNAWQFSDLDLAYKEKIPDKIIRDLKEKFEESYLPFTVDIVDFNGISESFRKKIENDLVELKL